MKLGAEMIVLTDDKNWDKISASRQKLKKLKNVTITATKKS